jgi:hypothetical protein
MGKGFEPSYVLAGHRCCELRMVRVRVACSNLSDRQASKPLTLLSPPGASGEDGSHSWTRRLVPC